MTCQRQSGLLRSGVMLVALWVATSDDWYREAWALTLSTPTEGTVLRSGEIVPVSVEAGKDVNLRGVKYYWYRADEDPWPRTRRSRLRSVRPRPSPRFPARFGFQPTPWERCVSLPWEK